MGRGAPRGNQNAAKGKRWEGALRRALSHDRKALLEIAKTLISAAKKGEPWAIEHLADRLDGRAKQTIAATVEHTVNTGDVAALTPALEQSLAKRSSPTVQ